MLSIESAHAPYAADAFDPRKDFVEVIEIFDVECDNALELAAECIDVDASDVRVSVSSDSIGDIVQHTGAIFARDADSSQIYTLRVRCPRKVDESCLECLSHFGNVAAIASVNLDTAPNGNHTYDLVTGYRIATPRILIEQVRDRRMIAVEDDGTRRAQLFR